MEKEAPSPIAVSALAEQLRLGKVPDFAHFHGNMSSLSTGFPNDARAPLPWCQVLYEAKEKHRKHDKNLTRPGYKADYVSSCCNTASVRQQFLQEMD
jgi:hypothetical protein